MAIKMATKLTFVAHDFNQEKSKPADCEYILREWFKFELWAIVQAVQYFDFPVG